ncbi:PREDICTED: transcriptional regulator ATRX-like [Camelina sativa]|uniref:Transcriptional regulator ATRX-like n=1 Tax=Camelina sativa TaxID=90675 RepID=A0ABM0UYU8_CAMSA|nr:PREDICTED: transcriptional regulator ATRX-like [Camelina sativa]XP_010448312.1 PREDICTED: transcriptional regulator ATRX-like [Camelina sativa]XP_019089671.1 PREDICTED: transcriptional regulator ATRX-like [Camelina sativa]
METVSEIGNSNDCVNNPESDKHKERSGKKKRKSRKHESELKNDDSHISSQNGYADGAFSSEEQKEGETEKSTSENQVQLSENRVSTLPAATLHHADPIMSTGEDSLPDANKNGSSRKKSKRREKKKKEEASCEEKMLDDVEKITNEDQVQPPNTLSNGIIQEGSHEQTQVSCEKPGAAQLCTGPNFSVQEDSQPDGTSLTCSQKRKREKKRDRNALKESDVDIHSTNAGVAVKYNTITEAEGSKSMSKEENSVPSVVINSCLQSKDETVEQQECTDVKLSEAVAQTQSPKAKKRKKRKNKTAEVSDPLGNILPTSTKSGSVECVENNDGNKETDGNTEVKEYVLELKCDTTSEADGSKPMNIEEKSIASVVISSCPKSKDDTVEQQECTDVKLSETVAQTQSPKAKKKKKRKTKTVEACDPLASTKSGSAECVEINDGSKETEGNTEVKEDVLEVKYDTISEVEESKSMSKEEISVASVVISSCPKSKDDAVELQECTDVNETVAQNPKAKRRKKRKTETVEVCDPLGNTLPTSTKSGSAECVENSDGSKETDGNTEVKEDVLEAKYDNSEAEESKSMSKEEISVASVMISSCPKSKDDTVEQQECTDVNETVAQNPKAKRRKKRKTETVEVCDPLGNTLSTSMKSGPVEFVENNDGNGGRELVSYPASQRENSVTGEGSGLQNLGKTEEKETDEKTRVKEDVVGAGVCDVRSKKQKGKKNKTSYAGIEVYEPSVSVGCLLDHSDEKDMQNCDGNAGQQFGGEDMTSKTEKSVMREKSGVQKSGKRKERTKDENIVSNQDTIGAEGDSDVARKRQKRKTKKKTNCESVAIMDSDCLLYQSNREGVENCDGNADGEIASKDLASNIEDSATKKESVQDVENTKKKKKNKKEEVDQNALGAEGVSKVEGTTKKRKRKKNLSDHKTDNMEDDSKKINDENGEVDQNALGAEGVSKVEVKTKKSKNKKNDLDHKTDDMEEKDAVSVPKDEEPEFDGEKLEMSLSSSVVIQNNMVQGVASSEIGSVPKCSCDGRTRKLLVFDLNGILADIVQGFTGQLIPDGKVSYRSVFRRPFVSSFLDFCFERFNVAIWSSRRIGLDYMVSIVMRNYARNLLFCFDQNKCTTTKFKTQEKNDKPLFLKDLRTVWERVGTCISCGNRKYDETNTLLVDDSPDKALCNPPYTGIFPSPYQYTDHQDSALGPEGELRKYLERLADAENVQKFVAENPFGQTAITETHESWEFYSKVVEAHK